MTKCDGSLIEQITSLDAYMGVDGLDSGDRLVKESEVIGLIRQHVRFVIDESLIEKIEAEKVMIPHQNIDFNVSGENYNRGLDKVIAIIRKHVGGTTHLVGEKNGVREDVIKRVAAAIRKERFENRNSLYQAKAAIAALNNMGHVQKTPESIHVAETCIENEHMGEPYRVSLGNSSKVALVDDADRAFVQQHVWNLDSKGYPRRRTPDDWVYLHTDILGVCDGMLPDHKDRDPLNNRRFNLRFLTRGQNEVNSPKAFNPNATSKYKGVSWDSEREIWVASICVNGKRIKIGRFASEEAAAMAYNAAAQKNFGDAAFLNTVSNDGIVGGLDASTRKDEEGISTADATESVSEAFPTSPAKTTCTACSDYGGLCPLCQEKSETSVIDEEKLIILMAQSLKISLDQARITSEEGGMYRYDAKQIMKVIRPYLRTTEPTIIDKALASAAEILANFKGEDERDKLDEWQACYAFLFRQANELMNAPKPVSLEECIKAVGMYHPERETLETYKLDTARGVLDAARVKYVD